MALAVALSTGCGQAVHPEDYFSVQALAYDDQGDLALGAKGTLIYLGPDRRERWRKELAADQWITSVAATSSTIVAWLSSAYSGPAFLVDVLRPEAGMQTMPDVQAIALAPDGRVAIQRPSNPPETQILDPRTGSYTHITSEYAQMLSFSPDGGRLYGLFESPSSPVRGSNPSRLVAFDAQTAAELWSNPVRLRNLRLSRDGTTLVGLLADPRRSPTVLTWNANDGTLLDTFSVPTPESTSSNSNDPLDVSPDGKTIVLSVQASPSEDCTKVFRAGTIAYSVPCLYAVAFSPDGSLIAGRRAVASPNDPDSLIFYRSADGTEVERRSLPRPFF